MAAIAKTLVSLMRPNICQSKITNKLNNFSTLFPQQKKALLQTSTKLGQQSNVLSHPQFHTGVNILPKSLPLCVNSQSENLLRFWLLRKKYNQDVVCNLTRFYNGGSTSNLHKLTVVRQLLQLQETTLRNFAKCGGKKSDETGNKSKCKTDKKKKKNSKCKKKNTATKKVKSCGSDKPLPCIMQGKNKCSAGKTSKPVKKNDCGKVEKCKPKKTDVCSKNKEVDKKPAECGKKKNICDKGSNDKDKCSKGKKDICSKDTKKDSKDVNKDKKDCKDVNKDVTKDKKDCKDVNKDKKDVNKDKKDCKDVNKDKKDSKKSTSSEGNKSAKKPESEKPSKPGKGGTNPPKTCTGPAADKKDQTCQKANSGSKDTQAAAPLPKLQKKKPFWQFWFVGV